MDRNKNEDNQENEHKSRKQNRVEMEQKAKASVNGHSNSSRSDRRNGGGRSGKSPRRRTSSEVLDEVDSSVKKPRGSSHSSKQHLSSSSRHRSKSRDSVDNESLGAKSSRSSGGRKERSKNRAEAERAIKAASKRPPFDPREGVVAQMEGVWEEDVRDAKSSMTSLSLADRDAELKRKERASRSRSRSTESVGSLKKPSRRHSSDDKAAFRSARSRRNLNEPIKPGAEKVRHRHRSREDDKLASSHRSRSREDDKLASSHRSANDKLASSNRSANDKLASSNRSANVRMLSSHENEVHVQAMSVDDTEDDARIQIIEQRNEDLEQRLDRRTQQAENVEAPSSNTEPPPTKNKAGVSRLAALLLFLFGIGAGVGIGYFLRGGCGCVPCKPCETEAPTTPPTPEATGAPTTTAPTIDFAYDPPSDEDCLRIQNSLPVNGQSELAVKTFDILVDTSLTSESLEASNWPEVLAQAMAEYLIPDLVGCPGSGNEVESSAIASAQNVSNDDSGGGSIRRKLRNIRYVIANAFAFGERRSYYSCENSAPTPCYKAAVTLTLLLKGDEPNVSLFTLISDVILAYDRDGPLVDKFGLATSGFAFVKIVGIEEVPYEPSSDTACDAIANKLPVPDQESMISKSFEVTFDVTLANSGVGDWLPQLAQGIQESMVPDMVCCGNSGTGTARMLRELDIGRNLRCAVGNAIPTTAREVPEVPCQPGRGGTCVPSVVSLQVFLKGDEPNMDIANMISNVILGSSGASIVDRYGFSRNVFSEINLVVVESTNPTAAPTFLPTPSPSVKMVETSMPSDSPTSAPVVGPTTKSPTRTPTISPTKFPTGRPVNEPTPPPTLVPTQRPTPSPTPGPTLPPAPGPTIAASQTPTLVPSETPSFSPSRQPSPVPSSAPSFSPSQQPSPVPSSAPSISPSLPPEPSSVPSSAPTSRRSYLLSLLEPHGSLTSPAFNWLADEDTWTPPSESSNRDVLWTERYAMASIDDSLIGLSGWKDGNSVCSWSGVTCAGEQVSEVDVANLGLTGSIPTEIGILTNLQDLVLEENNLSGSIPASLSSLTNLKKLLLATNDISGFIPSFIGSLTALTKMDFGENDFTGTIPTQLGQLTLLKYLSTSDTKITGSIPTEIGLLVDLKWLKLHNYDGKDLPSSGLSGTLPSQLSQLTDLLEFDIKYCHHISGTIPSSFASLTKLEIFNARHNKLDGSFPPQLGSLTNLDMLSLEYNALTGTIPASIGDLTKLTRLTFDRNNDMDGTLPTELGRLTELTHLYLSYTDFSGTIPTEIGLLRSIKFLDFGRTKLSGTIPMEFNGLSPTANFGVKGISGAGLTGPLPSMTVTSGKCKLDGNCFTGSIAGCSMDNSGCP